MKQFWRKRYIQTPVIYGRRLKPLTLGHRFLLRQVESPFLEPNSYPTELDLFILVFICSQDYETSLSYLTDERKLLKEVQSWLLKYNIIRYLYKQFTRDYKEISIEDRLKIAYSYLYQDNIPLIKVEEDNKKKIECPEELYIKVMLQRYLGYSEKELMNKLWSDCIWEVSVILAMEGVIEIMDEEYFDQIRQKGEDLINRLRKCQ